MLDLVKQLAKAMKDINHSDITKGNERHRNQIGQENGKGYKGKQKGKGKSTRPSMRNRSSESCSCCGKPGHQNRDCRKRQYDEKQEKKPTHNNNSRHATPGAGRGNHQ